MAASKLAWHLLENQVLADEFVGVTADGTVETGLFPIFSTGVSTAPVREAAEAFIDSLDPGLRERALFPVDDSEW